jgi:hypothetical protein
MADIRALQPHITLIRPAEQQIGPSRRADVVLGAIRPGNEKAKADASATGDAKFVIQIVVLVGTKQSSLPCALK